MERIFLGLGSNLGDRMANLLAAIEHLRAARVIPVRSSSCYETEPVGGPSGQDKYLNAVIEVTTSLEPAELLDVCKRIERALGRRSGPRCSPRPVDIDILLWGSRLVREPGIEIPHPDMTARAFVLIPLDEIAPEVYNPVCACSVHELTLQLSDTTGVERLSEPFTVECAPGRDRDC